MPLALCSKQLFKTEQEKLAFSIYKNYQKHLISAKSPRVSLNPEKPIFPQVSPDTCVSDFVDDRSVIVFQRLDLSLHDVYFLTYSKIEWCDFDECKKLKMFISNPKIVNDVAERGVKQMEEFKDILTDDMEQRKMLLHCVEDSRTRHPDFRKSSLAEKYQTIIVSNRDRFFYHCKCASKK